MSPKSKPRPLIYLAEPGLKFAHGQRCIDPRDGLSMFGPLNSIYGIRSGVVGTAEGLRLFNKFLTSIQKPTFNTNNITRPMFPGFEAVFNCKWESQEIVFKEVTQDEINSRLYSENVHKRTFDLVTLFIERILEAKNDSDENIDIWFIVVPEEIYRYCRPNQSLPKDLVQSKRLISKSKAKEFVYTPGLFAEINQENQEKEVEASSYAFDAQFHHQLKARLLPYTIPTQIVRQTTLDWRNHQDKRGRPIRDFSKIEGHLAWTFSTGVFYKAGGKPWKLSEIRRGVCYLGLVYKQLEKTKNPRNACCAAQMFLDNGDGTVFKGEVGEWWDPDKREFHLTPDEATQLLNRALKSYREQNQDRNPKEVFIHARTRFDKTEWQAFQKAAPKGTNLVGVTISKSKPLKLYRQDSDYPVLRGLAYVISDRAAYLWTVGFAPKTQTALGLEVPNPLFIEINKGRANIEQVLKDVLALTKLNYNACIFGDGMPVTLRFADYIGEILTAGADIKAPPLAFKYYI